MGKLKFTGLASVSKGLARITFLELITTSGGSMLTFSQPASTPTPLAFSVDFGPTSIADYFAQGGQIRMQLEHTGFVADPQSVAMNQTVEAMGQILFGETTTMTTGTAGAQTNVGSVNLTGTDTTIFTANSVTGGIYITDHIQIDARIVGNAIQFRVYINDAVDLNPSIDNPVTGTMTLLVDERRYHLHPSGTYAQIS